jgi:hypothetical protein
VITFYKRKTSRYIRTTLVCFILFSSGVIFGQPQTGTVFSSKTNAGIGYVNIGIIGRDVGTVSDDSGKFTITINKIYDNDSLRFYMIGYESRSFLVRQFRENPVKDVYMTPVTYDLQEVKIVYSRPRKIILGTEVTSDELRSGFGRNDLGSELGIKVKIRKPVKLINLNLNVAVCTYDSVTYRLNIYQADDQAGYSNILTRPIYISFSKDKIGDVLTFDLREYSIIIEKDALITLELYKDLGEGKLLFYTTFFTGFTSHKKTSEGTWTESPGVIGMYLNGQILK